MCRGTTNMEDVYLIETNQIPKSVLNKLNKKWIMLHGGIPVDKCIGREIEHLIKNGVATVGSCCGHGEMKVKALAFESEGEKLKKLGYYPRKYGDELVEFELKLNY